MKKYREERQIQQKLNHLFSKAKNTRILLLLRFSVLRLFVSIEFCSGMKYLITQVTWVTEHVGIVMRFHMVPCAGTVTGWENLSQRVQ